MVKYRRLYIPNAVYFFTVVLHDRRSNWLIKYIEQLKNAIRRVKILYPFKTKALVILPDHLHVMWQLPENDANYSLRWRLIKIQFTNNLRAIGINILQNAQEKNLLWQKRFWEHTIRDEKDYEAHFNYIHYNPVKHNYVKKVEDWPFASFHHYVKNGLLTQDWSYHADTLDLE